MVRTEMEMGTMPGWMHEPGLSRHDAEELIAGSQGGLQDGKFLLRPRPGPLGEKYALTVVYMGRCTHHLVSFDHAADGFLINKKQYGSDPMRSIEQVVERLAAAPAGWPVGLDKPILRAGATPLATPLTTPTPAPEREREPEQGEGDEPHIDVSLTTNDSFVTVAPWLHGLISRHQAEERITSSQGGLRDGKFLVRPSNSALGNYTLSVVYKGKVTYHLMERRGDGVLTINGHDFGQHWSNVPAVIRTLSESMDPPCPPAWPVPLTLWVAPPPDDGYPTMSPLDLFDQQPDGSFPGPPPATAAAQHLRARQNSVRTVAGGRLGDPAPASQPLPAQPLGSITDNTEEQQEAHGYRVFSRDPDGDDPYDPYDPYAGGQDNDEETDCESVIGDPAAAAPPPAAMRPRPTTPTTVTVMLTEEPSQQWAPPPPDVEMVQEERLPEDERAASEQRMAARLNIFPLQYDAAPVWTDSTASSVAGTPQLGRRLLAPAGRSTWLHGPIPKEVAALRAENSPGGLQDGKFLFRPRPAHPGDFVLLVVYNQAATHHVVSRNPADGSLTIMGRTFGDKPWMRLEDIVETLSKPGVAGWPVQLTEPIAVPGEVAAETAPFQLHRVHEPPRTTEWKCGFCGMVNDEPPEGEMRVCAECKRTRGRRANTTAEAIRQDPLHPLLPEGVSAAEVHRIARLKTAPKRDPVRERARGELVVYMSVLPPEDRKKLKGALNDYGRGQTSVGDLVATMSVVLRPVDPAHRQRLEDTLCRLLPVEQRDEFLLVLTQAHKEEHLERIEKATPVNEFDVLTRLVTRGLHLFHGDPRSSLEATHFERQINSACTRRGWSALHLQANNPRREFYDVELLAKEIYTAWASGVTQIWDDEAYGPPPINVRFSKGLIDSLCFSRADGFAQYRKRTQLAAHEYVLPGEAAARPKRIPISELDKRGYRVVAEVLLSAFATRFPGQTRVVMRHDKALLAMMYKLKVLKRDRQEPQTPLHTSTPRRGGAPDGSALMDDSRLDEDLQGQYSQIFAASTGAASRVELAARPAPTIPAARGPSNGSLAAPSTPLAPPSYEEEAILYGDANIPPEGFASV